MFSSLCLAQVVIFFILGINAESHVVKFVNRCGYGSPALMYNGKNILTGDTYTSDGPFSGIAYLQTGGCNTNGENCTLLETTLINSACPGCGSSTDISLIPPHEYNVETSFAYYDGCDGRGNTCSSPSCTTVAFFSPNDYYAQVACEVDNVNLLVAFCVEAAQLLTGNGTASGGPMQTSSHPESSSTPILESSKSGSMTPVPFPTATAAPTKVLENPSEAPSSAPLPTQTSTATTGGYFSDSGCEETGETTPMTPTLSPIPTPTAASSNSPEQGCEGAEETTLPSPSTPTPLPTETSSTSRRCRSRPTGLTPSSSTPGPTYVPTITPIPVFKPTTTLTPSSGSASSGSETVDPCDYLADTSMPASWPPAQRRRHRRTNRILY